MCGRPTNLRQEQIQRLEDVGLPLLPEIALFGYDFHASLEEIVEFIGDGGVVDHLHRESPDLDMWVRLMQGQYDAYLDGRPSVIDDEKAELLLSVGITSTGRKDRLSATPETTSETASAAASSASGQEGQSEYSLATKIHHSMTSSNHSIRSMNRRRPYGFAQVANDNQDYDCLDSDSDFEDPNEETNRPLGRARTKLLQSKGAVTRATSSATEGDSDVNLYSSDGESSETSDVTDKEHPSKASIDNDMQGMTLEETESKVLAASRIEPTASVDRNRDERPDPNAQDSSDKVGSHDMKMDVACAAHDTAIEIDTVMDAAHKQRHDEPISMDDPDKATTLNGTDKDHPKEAEKDDEVEVGDDDDDSDDDNDEEEEEVNDLLNAGMDLPTETKGSKITSRLDDDYLAGVYRKFMHTKEGPVVRLNRKLRKTQTSCVALEELSKPGQTMSEEEYNRLIIPCESLQPTKHPTLVSTALAVCNKRWHERFVALVNMKFKTGCCLVRRDCPEGKVRYEQFKKKRTWFGV